MVENKKDLKVVQGLIGHPIYICMHFSFGMELKRARMCVKVLCVCGRGGQNKD